MILIMVFCVLLCSCYDGDPYEGKRPDDYPNSYWVCNEFDSYFVVNEPYEIIDSQIVINGQKIPFTLLFSAFDERGSIKFIIDSKKENLPIVCKFNEKKFEITIVDTKGFYSEEKIVMEFERKAIDDYWATRQS